MTTYLRPQEGGGPSSSRTQLQNTNPPAQTTTAPRQAVLRLRGATREDEDEAAEASGTEVRRRIQWAEDVVNNEGMGRKSSKVCCIYHAPKEFGESSDESSSDSSSDDSDSGDNGAARPSRNGHGNNHEPGRHDHHYNHDHGKDKGKGKGKARARSPNAYEKIPKNKTGGMKETK